MMKKALNSVVKVSVCIVVMACLLLGPGCQKSPDEQPSTPTTSQANNPENKQTAKEPDKPVVQNPPSEVKPPPTNEQPPKQEEPKSSGSDDAINKDSAKPGWLPVDIKLPKPMFVGTPQDTKVPNLEKPTGKPRPPFLAPPGTKNVAFEKPVTSTDDFPIIGELEMITDGDKEAADGSYVELGPLKQSVTIDLEAEYTIYAIVIWHYHKQARVYYDVVVQVSGDADFIETKTLYNNDTDNSAGLGVGEEKHYTETNEGRLIDARAVKARYVRLYTNGNNSNDLNHYIEVEVYGKPAG